MNMRFFISIWFLILSLHLCCFVFSEKKIFNSIVVSKNDGKFKLNKPTKCSKYNGIHKSEVSKTEKKYQEYWVSFEEETYHFCPLSEKKEPDEYPKNALYCIKYYNREHRSLTTRNILRCSASIDGVFSKVENPGDLNPRWNDKLELYHSGFLLKTKDLPEDEEDLVVENSEFDKMVVNDEDDKENLIVKNSELDKMVENDDDKKDFVVENLELDRMVLSDENLSKREAVVHKKLYSDKMVVNDEDLSKTEAVVHKKPKYSAWKDDYELIPMLEVYFDKNIQQTVAVKYEIISTKAYEDSDIDSEDNFKNVSPLEDLQFIRFSKKDEDIQLLFKKGGAKWQNYFLKHGFLRNVIHLMPLAPSQHFPILIWQRPVRIKPNLVPMLETATLKWHKVTFLARIIAKYLGDLKVTVGTTGTMSIPNERKIRKSRVKNHEDSSQVLKSGEESSQQIENEEIASNNQKDEYLSRILIQDEEKKFRIPDYFWAAFEYKEFEKWYGILVILHCNSFINDTKPICEDVCEVNQWPVSNSDFRKGKIYCCEMTEDNIKKLNADYLLLEEREIFNLNNWDNVKEEIIDEFEYLVYDYDFYPDYSK